jgi:hypothetical protein
VVRSRLGTSIDYGQWLVRSPGPIAGKRDKQFWRFLYDKLTFGSVNSDAVPLAIILGVVYEI